MATSMYEAMLDKLQDKYPDLTREELKEKFDTLSNRELIELLPIAIKGWRQ